MTPATPPVDGRIGEQTDEANRSEPSHGDDDRHERMLWNTHYTTETEGDRG